MSDSAPPSLILDGPLRTALWRIAWPSISFQLLVFLNNFVDYQWVKELGQEAAAGQGAAWTTFWMMASLGQIFSTGATAVVARRVGEKRYDDARHAGTQGLRGALMASVVVGAAAWLAVPLLVGLYALSPGASGHAADYLYMLSAGAPAFFFFYATEGVFKGHGDMRRPLRAVATALALNIVLDPLLIFGAGLEVQGAALATVIAFAVTGGLLAWSGRRRDWIRFRERGIDFRIIRRVIRIGAPVSVHGIIFSGVYVFIMRETSQAGGDAATAALSLGLRIEGLAFMTAVGFATAAATMVGQNLGAGQPRRAHDAAWLAVRVAVWLTGIWGLLMIVAPDGVIDVLSPGPASTGYAADYLKIAGSVIIFTAIEIVLEGAFAGAGDTVPAMLLGLPFTLVRVPAAILARTMGLGVNGIFWALALTSVVRGLGFAFWFARGNWVHAKA
jgi:putative MATE family efflux protein